MKKDKAMTTQWALSLEQQRLWQSRGEALGRGWLALRAWFRDGGVAMK